MVVGEEWIILLSSQLTILAQALPNTNQNAVEWSKDLEAQSTRKKQDVLMEDWSKCSTTKDLLAERVGSMDTLYNLCNEEVETLLPPILQM